MFCPECGKSIPDDSGFCTECGAKVTPQPVAQPVQQQQQQQQQQQPPVYQPPIQPVQPLVYAQPQVAPAYYPPVAVAPKPKKHIGLYVLLSILILLLGTIVYGMATIFWLPPKDLGIRYTKADYNSFMKKIGIIKDKNPTGGKISDYNYVFSGTKQVDVELSSEELTAWLNENRPSYFVIKKSQVRINSDGSVEASGEVDFDSTKYLITKDIAGADLSQVPIPIPPKANVYIKTSGSMTNNVPDITSGEANIGVVSATPVLTPQNINFIEQAITTILQAEIPTMKIQSLTFSNGKVHIVGEIPQYLKRVAKSVS